jgi:hypothetical protein
VVKYAGQKSERKTIKTNLNERGNIIPSFFELIFKLMETFFEKALILHAEKEIL